MTRPGPTRRLDEQLSYTIEQASDVSGIAHSTLRELCARGDIPARKVGRRWIISRRALLAYIDGGAGDASSAQQVVTFKRYER
jgi:excisionase family DNA binding protein